MPRSHQLPLYHQARYIEVHLVGKETLRTHRREPQHHLEHPLKVRLGGQRQGLEVLTRRAARRAPLELILLGRQLPQDVVQGQINRSAVVHLVVEHQDAITGDPADHGERDVLPRRHGLEYGQPRGPHQEGVALLRLVAPDLEDRQRPVSHRYGPQVDHSPGRLHDLGQSVAVAARSQVVSGDDGVRAAEFHAGPHETVDPLLHLRVAALHGVEVELLDVLALLHAAGGSSAHADAIGRAAHLHHQHVLLGATLHGVFVSDLARSHAVHDGFEPGAVPVGQAQAVSAGESVDQRLAEAVAVVGGAVAGLDEYLGGRSQVGGMRVAVVFPGELVTGQVEIADAIRRPGGTDESAPSYRLVVTDPAAAAGGRPGIGSHPGGEVVRLGRQRGMQ